MNIEIYSDVVCPWCYIGERRLSRALERFGGADDVEVVFRPFQLDPAAPQSAVPLKEYLAERFGPRAGGMREHVGEVAAGEGIAIDWDRALSVNTRTAHRLLKLAEREHGAAVQRALAEGLFDLHFTRGGDLTDPEALTELAGSVGMETDRIRAFLGSDEGLEELDADLARARRRGIRAVPTFIIDGEAVLQGAQPIAVFLSALQQAQGSPQWDATKPSYEGSRT